MESSVADRVVLVTGASRGIGAAIAEKLGSHGASVIVNYHSRKAEAEGVLARVRDSGGDGMIRQADVRDPAAVQAMATEAIAQFGRIDVLVNNANIEFPIKPFVALTWDEIEAKLTGEIGALYNCAQAVLPGMLERGSGKLILISSTLSRQPGYGFAAHAGAKAAVDSMARVMASELGPQGVTVNVVGPGLVKTDATAGQPPEVHEQIAAATPLRRVGMPDDIGGVVLFLASAEADFLTGQYLPVSGGSFMF